MKKMECVGVPFTHNRASAQKNLSGSELRLFLYLCDMAIVTDGKAFPLDRSAIANDYGMGIASYNRALKGLQEKGFVQTKDSQTYLFDASGHFRD